MRIIGSLLAAILLLALPTGARAQTSDQSWPRWRGARADGTVVTGRAVFDRPFALRVRWKKTLGAGYSGIAVDAGHAVTMFSDGTTDFLVGLAAETGEERWRVPLAATFPPRDGSTGGPVSTPAIHDGIAYGLGPRGELVAVALTSGKVLWQTHLVQDLGAVEPHWGFTTSPLVAGDLLIVLTGGAPDRAVTAFDRRTGAVRWRAGSDAASYQSPMLVTSGGVEAVLTGGDTSLMALDVRDGRELWKKPHGGTGFFALIINPVALGADRWLITHQPGQSVLLDALPGSAPIWTTRELRGNYSQPVVHRGVIFGMAGTFLSAVDAATGERLWRSRPPGDGFPILVDGHLVIATKAGGVTVVEATGTAYREKASLQVFDRLLWTPPSFADGRIFMRDSYNGIAAVDIVPDATTPPAVESASSDTAVISGSAFAREVARIEASADPQAAMTAYLAAHPAMPIVESGRYAHFLYSGDTDGLELRVDGRDADAPLALTRVRGTDTVYASLPFEADARISYQFFRHGTDVVDDPRNSRKATSLNRAGASGLFSMPSALAMPALAAEALRGSSVGFDLEIPPMRVAHLQWGGKRPVHVYLPPGYDAAAATRYPVVYVMYGDEMREVRFDALVDRAIGARMAPAIVVFLPSTSGFEYARTFRDAHRRMLATLLVPEIDRRFRTRAAARDRVLVGVDEAGFGVVDTVLQHPDVFGAAVAQSVFSMTGIGDELLARIGATAPAGQRFHLDWGTYDYRRASDLTDVPGYSRAVRDALAARGFAVTGRGWHDGMSLELTAARIVDALAGLLPAR